MSKLKLFSFFCLFFLFATRASADSHTITSVLERDPNDLDAHFFGPTDATGKSPFHVYSADTIEGLSGTPLNVTPAEAAEKKTAIVAPVAPGKVRKKNTDQDTDSGHFLGFDKAQLDALIKDTQSSLPIKTSPPTPEPVKKKPRRTRRLANTNSTPAPRPTSIGMPTGSTIGTYYSLGVDIARLALRDGLVIDVKTSSGSLDNIRRMASNENAGLAIVQSDVIDYLSSNPSQSNQSIISNLRSVFTLYTEEIHLLVSNEIKTLQDLNKKRIIVGEIGSGTPITASRVFDKIGIDIEQITGVPPEAALRQLMLGKVDAIFLVGGKPLIYINGLLEIKNDDKLGKYTEGFHLMPLDDERLYGTYTRAQITPADYQSKNGLYRLTETVVPTIAVQALLVSYDFSKKDSHYHKMRCEQLSQLNSIVRENLATMASNDNREYHPKWAQVELDKKSTLAKSQCIDDSTPKETDLKAINCYLQTGNNCTIK